MLVRPHLETNRLRLRPVTATDLDALHALWTDKDVRKYLWDDRVITRDETAGQLALSHVSFDEHGFGHWAVSVAAADDLIGFASLRYFGDPPEVEVLCGFYADHWGQGLATEAAAAVMQYGFHELGLDSIYGGADPPNRRSFALMERLSMRFAKRMTIGGIEAIYHVVTRDEFAPPAATVHVTNGGFRVR